MKILRLLTVSALLFFCLGLLPVQGLAFTQSPIAVVVIDRSGNVDSQLVEVWRDRVNRRFRFPHYRIIEQREVDAALAKSMPQLDPSRPFLKQEQLEKIADATDAQMVFAIWVVSLRDRTFSSGFPWGEAMQRSRAVVDVTVYRQQDGFYQAFRLNHNQTRDLAISTEAQAVVTQWFSGIVDRVREALPELKE